VSEQEFSFDAAGNRTLLAAPEGTTTYEYATKSDRLLKRTLKGLVVTCGYDKNGALVAETNRESGRVIARESYAWDGDRRLVGYVVVKSNGGAWSTNRAQYRYL
jgi:YD repeat-containing protein